MKYQIDQSGKVEQTSKATVVALSNDKNKAVVISGKDKRRLQERFRQIGMPRLFVIVTFSILVYFVLKSFKDKFSAVYIDVEYPGHTTTIRQIIEELIDFDIRWAKVGKNSSAHDLAYKVYKQKAEGDRVTADEVWSIAKKLLKRKRPVGT